MAHAVCSEGLDIPPIRALPASRPLRWLGAGWRDLRRAPWIGMTYGSMFAAMGAVLTLGLASADRLPWIVPGGFGFVLLGPLLAVGLYEVSRCLEQGLRPRLTPVLNAWRANPAQIGVLGVALIAVLVTWLLVANLIFALFFSRPIAGWHDFYTQAFLSGQGLPFLTVGTLVGAVFAVLVFSITVISIPMLLDRKADVITAMVTSIRAARRNPATMAVWAGMILVLTAAGLMTLYIGLIVVLPLIGHATWHAYRDLVAANGR